MPEIKHGFAKRNNKDLYQKYFYARWETMKTRCNNPNRDDWKSYGGRGIKVYERWLDFENFIESYVGA